MNHEYVTAMKDARDFIAKLELEQAAKLSAILDRIDEARRAELKEASK